MVWMIKRLGSYESGFCFMDLVQVVSSNSVHVHVMQALKCLVYSFALTVMVQHPCSARQDLTNQRLRIVSGVATSVGGVTFWEGGSREELKYMDRHCRPFEFSASSCQLNVFLRRSTEYICICR